MAAEHDHVVSPKIYIKVLSTLMLLLVVTVAAACLDLDHIFHAPYWNMTIAVLIAITKAVLIILFFMHVKYNSQVVWAFASAAFVWLGIMMGLSLSDYTTRKFPEASPAAPTVQAGPAIIPPAPRPDAGVPGASAAPLPHANPQRTPAPPA